MSFLQQLEKYRDTFSSKSEQYVKALVDRGQKFASNELNKAQTTSPDSGYIESETSKKTGEITLVGNAKGGAGFIEFGTGTKYTSMAESHPRAEEFGAFRGEFGAMKGADPPWVFFGEAGELGEDVGKGFVKTSGQPASRVMYNTGKELERIYQEVAKEVFTND